MYRKIFLRNVSLGIVLLTVLLVCVATGLPSREAMEPSDIRRINARLDLISDDLGEVHELLNKDKERDEEEAETEGAGGSDGIRTGKYLKYKDGGFVDEYFMILKKNDDDTYTYSLYKDSEAEPTVIVITKPFKDKSMAGMSRDGRHGVGLLFGKDGTFFTAYKGWWAHDDGKAKDNFEKHAKKYMEEMNRDTISWMGLHEYFMIKKMMSPNLFGSEAAEWLKKDPLRQYKE